MKCDIIIFKVVRFHYDTIPYVFVLHLLLALLHIIWGQFCFTVWRLASFVVVCNTHV